MRGLLITERIYAELIELYKINLAYWDKQRHWTAGHLEKNRNGGGTYHQVEARSSLEAVEQLAKTRGWIDRDGNPI